jgi:signal transduction histidine kinase
MAKVPIDEALRPVLAQARRDAEQLGMSIEEELDPGLPQLYGNGNKLHQVFMNICRNALQAMGAGGRLSVRARRAAPPGGGGPREVAISFTDTGPGIPESIMPRIFDPFFTTKDVGTGLGLAISAKIIEAHGGRIEVDSPPGKGATFTVILPAPSQSDTDRFPPVS